LEPEEKELKRWTSALPFHKQAFRCHYACGKTKNPEPCSMCVSGCALSRLVRAKRLALQELDNDAMSKELENVFLSGFGSMLHVTVFAKPSSLWKTEYPCLTTCRAACGKWHADFRRYWLLYGGSTKVTVDDTFPRMSPRQVVDCVQEIGRAMLKASPLCTPHAAADDRRQLANLLSKMV
jgi:hypothetical protein